MRRIPLGGVAGVLLLAIGTRAAEELGIGGPRLGLPRWHLLSDPAARHADLGYGYYQARTDTDRKLRNHIRLIQALGVNVTIPGAA